MSSTAAVELDVFSDAGIGICSILCVKRDEALCWMYVAFVDERVWMNAVLEYLWKSSVRIIINQK